MRTIRKLTVFDAAAIHDHFNRLDPETRRRRFMGFISDTALEKYADETPSPGHYAVGCFIEGRLRALGELVMPAWPSPAHAEIAFSVEHDFQGQGVGQALMDHLLTLAANRGARRVQVTCLTDNFRMRKIIEKFHGETVACEGGVLEAEVEAGAPSFRSLWRESAHDWRGFALRLTERAA